MKNVVLLLIIFMAACCKTIEEPPQFPTVDITLSNGYTALIEGRKIIYPNRTDYQFENNVINLTILEKNNLLYTNPTGFYNGKSFVIYNDTMHICNDKPLGIKYKLKR